MPATPPGKSYTQAISPGVIAAVLVTMAISTVCVLAVVISEVLR